MIYLLDTNICVYIIKNRPTVVKQRFVERQLGDIGISSITVAELQVGVERNQKREQAALALAQFLQPLQIADFDQAAAAVYGKLRVRLEAQGLPIGLLDMLIAAHALSLNAVLVTNNLREFGRVADLKVENWVSG
jgi:tRNA(fMet)-specific endonuclease VapC